MTTTDQAPEAPPENTVHPTPAVEPGVQVEKLEHIEEALSVLPEQGEWQRLCVMARTLAMASAAPGELRGKPADMLLVLLTARDLEIKATDAMRTVQVVKGKVTLAPRLKIALVERRGLGRVRPCSVDPRTGECPTCGSTTGNTVEQATAHAFVNATGEVVSFTFTMEDAQRAKIVKADGAWLTYPQRMLWWRASGYLVDDVFPEAAIGIYSPDEMGAMTDEDGNYIDVNAVEIPEGFSGKGHDSSKPEPLTDELKAGLADRIGRLPDQGKVALRALWTHVNEETNTAALPPLAELFDRHLVKAEAMVVSIEKRATKGEWGYWDPDEPAPQPAADERPADAPLSTPDGSEAPTLLDASAEPQGEAQGQVEPTDEAVAAAIAHVQAIDKRQVVLELGSHEQATTGIEATMRKRLALFYAEHPDQLPT